MSPDEVRFARLCSTPLLMIAQVPRFQRVYDALDKFKGKAQMAKYNVGELKKGDIVLVEMYVTRWAIKDGSVGKTEVDKAKRFKKNQVWNKWNVEFRLDAMSVLYPGSDYEAGGARADEDFEA